MKQEKQDGHAEGNRVIQYNTIKVRLCPTPEQEELFQKTFGCCRYIWNQMLSDHERFYEETDAHFIPTPAKYKKGAPFLKEVDNQALTQEYNRLSQAFRNFFRDPKTFGYPKFKRKKDDRDSFTACNQFFGSSATIYATRDAVRMTKAGLVKAKFSRRPRSGWKLTRLTVERTKTGKYYGYLLYTCPTYQPEPVEATAERTIGLKYSVSHFYVADNGNSADPPRWLRQSQEKLAVVQRKLSRSQPGSQNYQELVQKYRLLHEHIANQRRDFLHKESRRIGQYILNEYIERGYYQTHIGHLVKHYAHKRDLLCQCLDGIADKGITYTKPRGGLLLWCDLEERINERRLYHEAESRGLLIMPGFLFYPKGYEGGGHVRLCFSNISDADIERGVQILSEALEHSVE